MPEEPIAGQAATSFAGLPIQPTGSGVQDLDIAYEQMRLSEAQQDPSGVAAQEITDNTIPTVDDEAARISAAHPS